ncbi:unnamed protein product [Nippostrongylus brasiliensis]|uniref:Palmitoyltransferase (inferred by orthology to a C. elegans protein) n=1 Tax=Nippostrongylus brasiliensis TaxID=27835 RepID=A0A0N4YW37_NIPBR|nr:unnamed protein product [Nippostrongylus brasiliensis]
MGCVTAIFLMFEAILFAIFTSVMFGTQVSAICSDETAIETLKRGAEDRQKAGSWKKNMQSVFGGPCSMRWLNPLIEPYVSKPACDASLGNIVGSAPSPSSTGTGQAGVSEHALMPGLVVERFDKDGLAAQYLQGLREHASHKQDYICRMMEEARILCHMQRWWSTVKVTVSEIFDFSIFVYSFVVTVQYESVTSFRLTKPSLQGWVNSYQTCLGR